MTATDCFEIEITVSGDISPWRPATRHDPEEGGEVEDLWIEDLGIVETVTRTTSLLSGIDRNDPAIKQLFANILAARETAAVQALARAA